MDAGKSWYDSVTTTEMAKIGQLGGRQIYVCCISKRCDEARTAQDVKFFVGNVARGPCMRYDMMLRPEKTYDMCLQVDPRDSHSIRGLDSHALQHIAAFIRSFIRPAAA